MKNILLFTSFFLLFFSCRGNRAVSEQMDRAETLLASHPDSAYAILDKIELTDMLGERLFARWCMLYCRAADKTHHDMAYIEQLNRALAWYKRHGLAEERAWIGLYLGRSFVEDKLYIPATKAYSEALDLAKEKQLYDVAGHICSYMANLYTYTGQHTEERRKYEEAAAFFQKAGNMRRYAFALQDIGRTWMFGDSLSLALDLMLKADSIVTSMNDSLGIASIANGLGNVYESMKEMEKAKSSFQRSFSHNPTDWAPNYLALSNLYYHNDMPDSARYYLEKAEGRTDNPYTPSDRLYLGYLIEKRAGDTEKALRFLEQYVEKKKTLYDKQKQVDIIDAEKRHNLYSAVKENRKLRIILYQSFIAFVLFCLLAGLLSLYRDRKRLTRFHRQQLLLDEKEWQVAGLEEKIKALTDNKEIDRLKELEWISRKEIVILKCDKLYHSLLLQKLKSHGQSGGAVTVPLLTEPEWNHIRELVDDACPDWLSTIESIAGTLTPTLIDTCYLSFFDLSLKEEASLLGLTADSVNKRRLRTRCKLRIVNKETTIRSFIIRQALAGGDMTMLPEK